MGQVASMGQLCTCDHKVGTMMQVEAVPICSCDDRGGLQVEAVSVDDVAESLRSFAGRCVRATPSGREIARAAAFPEEPMLPLPRLLGQARQEEEAVPLEAQVGRKLKAGGALGVLRLDGGLLRAAPGDVAHPGSYEYGVRSRVVPGLTLRLCQSGQMPPQVERKLVEAVRQLDADGDVVAIAGDCGFMLYFQALARQHTKKPVFMSPLAQLPAVASAYDKRQPIAVFTASCKALASMRPFVRHACSVDLADPRYIVVECQDVPGFAAAASGERAEAKELMPGIVSKVMAVVSKHPGLVAILLESAELPPLSDALRLATGLPVYDAISASNFFMSGMQAHPWFGAEEDWFGAESGAGHLGARALGQKTKAGSLGVLCLEGDGDRPAAPQGLGDWGHEHDVHYHVVPGLTAVMCRSGKMAPEVEREFIKAVRYLDLEKDVSGFAGHAGCLVHFQALARRHTSKPVFLSPLAQLPAVACAHAEGERIAIFAESAEGLARLHGAVRQECGGLDLASARFLAVGCQEVLGLVRAAAPAVGASRAGVQEATARVAAKAKAVVAKHPDVRAIVLECMELSPCSDAIRRATGRPVYDAVTACDLFMSGLQDNPRFAAAAAASPRRTGPPGTQPPRRRVFGKPGPGAAGPPQRLLEREACNSPA